MEKQPNPSEGSPSFRVRPARRGDAEGIARLMQEVGYPDGGDAQTVHWVVSHPEIELLVAADRADKVVGLISMSHRPLLSKGGRIASIEELIVTAEWHRRGVGSQLLRQAVERAKVLSVKSLELNSRSAKPEIMQAFCAKAGFNLATVEVFQFP